MWYNSYNLIKHDRVKNFKEANIGNLINSLAALFLLNVYYMGKDFYLKNDYRFEAIISKIEGFSEIFKVDYTLIPKQSKTRIQRDTFIDSYSYFEMAKPYSTYIIETDKVYKTDSDRGADALDKLESKVMIHKDGVLTRKYDNYELRDHQTICSIVATLNKSPK